MAPLRQLVIAAFAVIQLVLGARLLIDLGVLPGDMPLRALIVDVSDALAAPVTAVAERLGAEPQSFGTGFDPAILTALVGWSLVEMVVLLIVGRTR